MLEERKIQKAKISLMRNPKFALLSGILMVGRTYVDDNTPTARTNGRDEWYGRKFINELTEKELAFVIAHEASHKMYRHLTTYKKLHEENAMMANGACDYVINLMLQDTDPEQTVITMPRWKSGEKKGEPMGLIDEKYRGMNSKQVFDLLKQNDDGSGEGGFDEHDWEEATKGMTDAEKRELARDIDQAIRQGLMAQHKVAGKGRSGGDRELEDLLNPKVDWREVLREFVKATCNAKDTSSWRRVNRRYLSTGMYMPSMIGERVGHIVIAVDTSGSVGQQELSEFLGEVKGVAEEVHPEKVDLIYWGSDVAGHEEYEGNAVANIVSSTKPKDGGGTSPSCVSDYLEEKKIVPECIIVLTDGYVGSDWGGNWTAPILWTIVGGNDVVSPNGKTIHINN
jgi:predicted metal-dependent peptidase